MQRSSYQNERFFFSFNVGALGFFMLHDQISLVQKQSIVERQKTCFFFLVRRLLVSEIISK
jgi:hypothetical protein